VKTNIIRMNMIRMKSRFCLAISMVLAPLFLQSQGSTSGGESLKPIVLMAEGTKGHVTYRIDSQLVTDPLLSLSRLEQRRGPSCPVIALIDPRLPI
jgi:hypothetical protein